MRHSADRPGNAQAFELYSADLRHLLINGEKEEGAWGDTIALRRPRTGASPRSFSVSAGVANQRLCRTVSIPESQ